MVDEGRLAGDTGFKGYCDEFYLLADEGFMFGAFCWFFARVYFGFAIVVCGISLTIVLLFTV